MSSPATNDFRSSGAVSWFIQHVMTLAGFMAALVPDEVRACECPKIDEGIVERGRAGGHGKAVR